MKKPRQRYTIEDLIRKQGRWIGGVDNRPILSDKTIYEMFDNISTEIREPRLVLPYWLVCKLVEIGIDSACSKSDPEYFSDEP